MANQNPKTSAELASYGLYRPKTKLIEAFQVEGEERVVFVPGYGEIRALEEDWIMTYPSGAQVVISDEEFKAEWERNESSKKQDSQSQESDKKLPMSLRWRHGMLRRNPKK